jgi:hypothetical protein
VVVVRAGGEPVVAEGLGEVAIGNQLAGHGFEDAGWDAEVAGDLGEGGGAGLGAAAEQSGRHDRLIEGR